MKRHFGCLTESIACEHQITRIPAGNPQPGSRTFAWSSQATDPFVSFRPASPRTVLSADSFALSCDSTSASIESNTESACLLTEQEVSSPVFVSDKGCTVNEFIDLNLREEGDCSGSIRDCTERHAGTVAVSTKRDNSEGDGEGMSKVAKRRCVAFDCAALPPLEAPWMAPHVREPDIPRPAIDLKRSSGGRSTYDLPGQRSASRSPSPVPVQYDTRALTALIRSPGPMPDRLTGSPIPVPHSTPSPCPVSHDPPCPLTRFKRQRPPTIDIPSKGCFTSSPAGTPDSAAEEALDGAGEAAESGAFFAVACRRGRKAVMEDTYQALPGYAGRQTDAFFGVFDGHGGSAAARFAASELANNVAEAARRRGGHASEEAMVEGYIETDRRFLEQDVTSGTSCLTCWATPGRLLLAHAGDSRAVLMRGGRGEAVTEDHRANRADEQRRIASLGGFVDTATGMARVQGILAVTRGLGDSHLKPFITAQPDAASVAVGADCAALILATDGLWDVVGNQEAADVLTACISAAALPAETPAASPGSFRAALAVVPPGAPPGASPAASPAATPPCKRARREVRRGWTGEAVLELQGGSEMGLRCSPLGTPPCTPTCTPHSRNTTVTTPPFIPHRWPTIATTSATATTATTTTPPCTPRTLTTTTRGIAPVPTPTPPTTASTTATSTPPPYTPYSHASTAPSRTPPRLSPSSSHRSISFLSPRSRASPPFAAPWLDMHLEPTGSVTTVAAAPVASAAAASLGPVALAGTLVTTPRENGEIGEVMMQGSGQRNSPVMPAVGAAAVARGVDKLASTLHERGGPAGGNTGGAGERGARDNAGAAAGGGAAAAAAVDGAVLLRACEALVDMAATRGSRDDVTVMIVSLAPFAESAC